MSTAAFGQVPVFADIALNKDIFYPPDQFEIWVRGANPGQEMAVDVYLSILMPDGRELFAPDFDEMAHPWFANLSLPQGLDMDWTSFYGYALPSIAFPLATPGQYMASLWLCAAGSDERITLGSVQQFTIAPCDRMTWVNDNQVWSLELGENGLWAGLMHGVEFIPYDSPIRSIWKGEDGVNSTRTYLFRGFEGTLMAVGGTDIGISMRHPFGWRRMLNRPGTFNYTYGVHAAVTDRDDTVWLCHKWPGIMSNEGELVRCWSSGYIEDHTNQIAGTVRSVVLTNEGKACAIGQDGLYVHQGDSFDFHEIEQFATEGTVLLNCAHGDVRGNVWMMVFANNMPYLYKYDLNTREMTVWEHGGPGIGNTTIDDITSDPMGNVWFAQRGTGLSMYDGTNFVAFPLATMPNCIAVGFDNTIYCGTYTDGIQVLKDGMWMSYENPNPEIDTSYGFLVGLSDGRALAAYRYPGYGFGMMEDGVWRRAAEDGESIPFSVIGVYPGETGLWAWQWGGPRLYRETENGWTDASQGSDFSGFGNSKCLLEDSNANPYYLLSGGLLTFREGTWATIDIPLPEAPFGYQGLWIDHDDNIYLCDEGHAIQHRAPDGIWTRIDDNDLLPAPPEAMELSESGLLYVCCKDDEANRYLAVVDDGEATSYSLDELGVSIDEVQAIVSDLAERVWIIAQAPDLSGHVVIFDPASEQFMHVPWESGLLPFKDFRNYAITYSGGVDRSMPQLGTLWCGSTPARMNFAPRTELLLDKNAYLHGESMRVDACFANQAGSIPIDWYAACEDEQGNLFYWPSYTQAKTPALAGLLVPTDTALILHLDDITIPDDVPPGHYKWKTGFTRAGQEAWLGLGFTASAEFDVVAD